MLFYFLARSKIFKLFIIKILTLPTLTLVDGGNNWITDLLQILKLLVIVLPRGLVIGIKPILSLRDGVSDSFLVIRIKLVSKLVRIFNCVTHGEDIVLEGVLGINALLDSLVLISELLGLLNHSLDLLWSESSLIIGNRNRFSLASSLLDSVDSKDTVLINLKGDLNLRDSSGGWWNT